MKDDALYLEADEDITSAIDKLHKSGGSSVQIVVPKRSTMLQSIINLKLLKKAAENDKKELILVTNDRVASDLAARVGLAVAPSLGAKAVISEPSMPTDLKNDDEVIEADDPEPPPPEPPVKKPRPKLPPLLKHRDLDDAPVTPPPETPVAPDLAGDETPKKPPRVPNFHNLQKRLLWLGLAVFLVGGYFVGMYFYSNAKVVLYASGTKVSVDSTFTVDPTKSQSDIPGSVLAGQSVTTSKTLSGTFTPTGKQDAGSKAAGSITISNCLDANTHKFVAGTRFVAPDGNTFLLDSDVTVPGGQGSFSGCSNPGVAIVAVTASANGDSYNEGPASYTIPGLPASEQTGADAITAKGAQMAGGVTKTVLVVVQPDVDTEQATLISKDQGNISSALASKVPSGYVGLPSSQATSVTSSTSNPAVGSVGSTASLQIHVTYTELAVKQSDYQALIQAQEQQQIGSANQIYDNGISSAQVTAGNKTGSGSQSFSFSAQAFSGAKLATSSIATQIAGHRYGDALNIAQALPGVTQATINIWPAWATSLPSKAGKINIVIKVANQ